MATTNRDLIVREGLEIEADVDTKHQTVLLSMAGHQVTIASGEGTMVFAEVSKVELDRMIEALIEISAMLK